MKNFSAYVLLVSMLVLPSFVFPQTDPEGQLDYIYIECPETGYSGRPTWLAFQSKHVIDNTQENKVSKFELPVFFSGYTVVEIYDTCWGQCFYPSAWQDFDAKQSGMFTAGPTTPPYDVWFSAEDFDSGITGPGLSPRLYVRVIDTGMVCVDTLSAFSHRLLFCTETGVCYTPGWGGTTGQGYPDSVGRCCKIDYCPIPGDANASGTLSLVDAISIVNYIFNKPGCIGNPDCWLSNLTCRGDWNADGNVTLTDVIRCANYIFNVMPGGPWKPLPSGKCCWVVS